MSSSCHRLCSADPVLTPVDCSYRCRPSGGSQGGRRLVTFSGRSAIPRFSRTFWRAFQVNPCGYGSVVAEVGLVARGARLFRGASASGRSSDQACSRRSRSSFWPRNRATTFLVEPSVMEPAFKPLHRHHVRQAPPISLRAARACIIRYLVSPGNADRRGGKDVAPSSPTPELWPAPGNTRKGGELDLNGGRRRPAEQ